MSSPLTTARPYAARALLTGAVAWLLMVSLCVTQNAVMSPAHDLSHVDAENHAAPAGHETAGALAHHEHSHHGKSDDGCCCQGYNAFTPQTIANFKVPVPSDGAFLFGLVWTGEFFVPQGTETVAPRATGPPDSEQPSDFLLRRSLLDHAPPALV